RARVDHHLDQHAVKAGIAAGQVDAGEALQATGLDDLHPVGIEEADAELGRHADAAVVGAAVPAADHDPPGAAIEGRPDQLADAAAAGARGVASPVRWASRIPRFVDTDDRHALAGGA